MIAVGKTEKDREALEEIFKLCAKSIGAKDIDEIELNKISEFAYLCEEKR